MILTICEFSHHGFDLRFQQVFPNGAFRFLSYVFIWDYLLQNPLLCSTLMWRTNTRTQVHITAVSLVTHTNLQIPPFWHLLITSLFGKAFFRLMTQSVRCSDNKATQKLCGVQEAGGSLNLGSCLTCSDFVLGIQMKGGVSATTTSNLSSVSIDLTFVFHGICSFE